MSETGDLPCVYCQTEYPVRDERGRVTCCQAGRDIDELGSTADTLATALAFYADPRHYEAGEVVKNGLRFPNLVAADAGGLAADSLQVEGRLDYHVSALRAAARGEPADFTF